MSKFCTNCGNEVTPGTNFCGKCGAKIEQSENYSSSKSEEHSINNDYPRLPERSIVTCVILSILTCGIYGVYWFICMTDEANAVSHEYNTSGGMAFLFSILTCGIYGIYWNYRMGQKLASAGDIHNKPIGDNAILYLVLSIVGLSLVNYCLIQNDLNRFSR